MTDEPNPPPGTNLVVDLAARRRPVCYTVRLTQHWDDRLEVFVEDVSYDDRSRIAVADALERAAKMLRDPHMTIERR